MHLHGFTLLRNGLKYDYPFRESLRSLTGLCEKTFLALGDSEDGTEKALDFPGLEIIPTIWDETIRKSGIILSQQTNIALGALRRHTREGWAFYLQADEVLDEKEYDQIRADIAKADQQGCDAVAFRYLHFWQSHARIAVGWKWYPQEIRAIRLDSELESYGDAQSFRPAKKIFQSDAHIFHYGHVREAKAYERKLSDFHRWWHSDAELARVKAKGAKRDRSELWLAYHGPHPSSMRERIGEQRLPEREILVFGKRTDLPEAFWPRVRAELLFSLDPSEVLKRDPADVVLLRTLSPLVRWRSFGRFKSQVPDAMGSPQARAWTPEFRATLLFSERGVRVE
jgi:hypothetical protein